MKLVNLAKELNIDKEEVESLLITCILDGQIEGKINQVIYVLVRVSFLCFRVETPLVTQFWVL